MLIGMKMNNKIIPGCRCLIIGYDHHNCRHLVGKECIVLRKVTERGYTEILSGLNLNPDEYWHIDVLSNPFGDYAASEKHLMRIDGGEELEVKETKELIEL
ncbi:MAG: hypothetical protein K0U78_14960 [Actinomycetia bacterium]|nr:hypothetical protein [Actinomycetes bacterium]